MHCESIGKRKNDGSKHSTKHEAEVFMIRKMSTKAGYIVCSIRIAKKTAIQLVSTRRKTRLKFQNCSCLFVLVLGTNSLASTNISSG